MRSTPNWSAHVTLVLTVTWGQTPQSTPHSSELRIAAVLDAGICERRTRLAGPPFRPAGCAVARAGVRRPFRGRRSSRPRDGGRTAVPGPAGGGVRPAGGCRRSERVLLPAPGADGTTVRASPTSRLGTRVGLGEDRPSLWSWRGRDQKTRSWRSARSISATVAALKPLPVSTSTRTPASSVARTRQRIATGAPRTPRGRRAVADRAGPIGTPACRPHPPASTSARRPLGILRSLEPPAMSSPVQFSVARSVQVRLPLTADSVHGRRRRRGSRLRRTQARRAAAVRPMRMARRLRSRPGTLWRQRTP